MTEPNIAALQRKIDSLQARNAELRDQERAVKSFDDALHKMETVVSTANSILRNLANLGSAPPKEAANLVNTSVEAIEKLTECLKEARRIQGSSNPNGFKVIKLVTD